MNFVFLIKILLAVSILLISAVLVFERLFLVGTVYVGTKSTHIKDGKFFVPGVVMSDKTHQDLLRWTFGNDKNVTWNEPYTTDVISLAPQASSTVLRATFINHSTVLFETKNVSFITDPIFSKRASPLSFAGPIRHHDPYVPLSAIPKLDIVFISHAHYDHLSIESIEMIEERFSPFYVTPLNNGQFIERAGVPKERIIELDIFENQEILGVHATLERAQHWNVRGFSDRNRYLWGSFVIEVENKKIFFAGDTGYASHFSEIKEMYGEFDIALLPIGAYEPRWFMKTQHMNPGDALQAAKDLGAPPIIGIHFGTFKITNEGRHDPEKQLTELLAKDSYPSQFLIPTIKNGLQIDIK